MRKYLTSFATLMATLFVASMAFAEEAAGTVAHSGGTTLQSCLAITSGLAIAIATFGGVFAQSRAATAALEGIARNPGAANKVQTPMIIALALIESLVIYALVIAFLLQGKI